MFKKIKLFNKRNLILLITFIFSLIIFLNLKQNSLNLINKLSYTTHKLIKRSASKKSIEKDNFKFNSLTYLNDFNFLIISFKNNLNFCKYKFLIDTKTFLGNLFQHKIVMNALTGEDKTKTVEENLLEGEWKLKFNYYEIEVNSLNSFLYVIKEINNKRILSSLKQKLYILEFIETPFYVRKHYY